MSVNPFAVHQDNGLDFHNLAGIMRSEEVGEGKDMRPMEYLTESHNGRECAKHGPILVR